ncbi:MAG: hypothetical protein HYR56_33300 [Acidobacteria bacterium]|nr:hypothetical protein [Acidobacteriota bacterium]MBI3422410.1 hypothetical protein [Acidobacteriota bacterium]
MNPIQVLRDAAKETPAVKYAWGLVGIAAAFAIITGLIKDLKIALVGICVLPVLMLVYFLFTQIVQDLPGKRWLTALLAWAMAILYVAFLFCLFTSFVFGWPPALANTLGVRPNSSLRSEEPLTRQITENDLAAQPGPQVPVASTPIAQAQSVSPKDRPSRIRHLQDPPQSTSEKSINLNNSPSPGAVFNTGDNVTINTRPTPRALTSAQKSKLISLLKSAPAANIEILYPPNNEEARSFAFQLGKALAATDWNLIGVVANPFGSFPPGLTILVRDASDQPVGAKTLQSALGTIGYPAAGGYEKELPGHRATILVGPQPNQ